MLRFKLATFLFLLHAHCANSDSNLPATAVRLITNVETKFKRATGENALRTVCYEPPALLFDLEIFKEAYIDLNASVSSYYVGKNESEVRRLYEEDASKFWQNLIRNLAIFPYASLLSDSRTNSIKLVGVLENAKTCAGFKVEEEVSVSLRIDKWSSTNVLLFVLAIILFFTAHRLARSAYAYYSVGSAVGVVAGILLVLFVATRFVSARKLAIFTTLSTLAGSIFARLSSYNVREIVRQLLADPENLPYIAGYVVLSASVAFIILFFFGPPRSSRTLTLLRSCIQGAALGLIYLAVQHSKVGVLFVLALVLLRVAQKCISLAPTVRRTIINPIRRFYLALRLRLIRPKPRLLTRDEYRRQADLYTQNSLEELRSYCRSTKCPSWKLVRQLHDPTRFASFVEGDSLHVTDSERTLHESFDINADVVSDVSNADSEPISISDSESELNLDVDAESYSSGEDCYVTQPSRTAHPLNSTRTRVEPTSITNRSRILKADYLDIDANRNAAHTRAPRISSHSLIASGNSSTPIHYSASGIQPNAHVVKDTMSKTMQEGTATGRYRYVRRRYGLRMTESIQPMRIPHDAPLPTMLDDLFSIIGSAIQIARSALSFKVTSRSENRVNVSECERVSQSGEYTQMEDEEIVY